MSIGSLTRTVLVLVYLTSMLCVHQAQALPTLSGSGRNQPDVEHTAGAINKEFIETADPASAKINNTFKWWKPLAQGAGIVKNGVGSVFRTIDEGFDSIDRVLTKTFTAVENMKREYEWHQYEVKQAHGVIPFMLSGGPLCFYTKPRRVFTEITSDMEFSFCDALVSSDGKYRAVNTGHGDIEVCTGENFEDCYTAINGRGWSNWGLTLRERFARNVKYLITRKQPIRTLPMERNYADYRVKNDGTWSMHDRNQGTITYGGKSYIKRIFGTPEPHITILDNNGALILKRVSDGKIVEQITKQNTK